jgi:hypothetical protein
MQSVSWFYKSPKKFLNMYLPLTKKIVFPLLGVCLAGSLFSQTLNEEILYHGHPHEDGELSVTSETLSLAFGDSISKELDEHAVWKIFTHDDGDVIATGIGSIEEYQFSIPGKYRLFVPGHTSLLEGTCKHHFETQETIIEVSPFRMKFDFSAITFSSPIIGGTELSNVEIAVPATLEVFEADLPEYNGRITSSGIGANLSGQLSEGPTKLKEGLNQLTFKLSGNAKKDTYIMLDFYDVNNFIHCYYFPNKLR